MNSGLKPESDEKSMSLIKDKKKLNFDIKIHTTRGVLFAEKLIKELKSHELSRKEDKES
jgi:hypothetical protein